MRTKDGWYFSRMFGKVYRFPAEFDVRCVHRHADVSMQSRSFRKKRKRENHTASMLSFRLRMSRAEKAQAHRKADYWAERRRAFLPVRLRR